MTYLYAGLGIAMLTAVMAMFQIAMGLTQQQIVSKPPRDNYLQSPWQSNDRQFLRLIKTMEESPKFKPTCDIIKNAIDKDKALNSPFFPGLHPYNLTQGSASNHARLAGACALVNQDHRVLIAPAPSGATGYRLYSCLIAASDVREGRVECKFEMN